MIATSDGRWVEETRPRVRLVVTVVAGRDGTIQTGFHGPAGLAGVEFIEANPPSATAEVAARRAVTMLDSVPAPAGEMTAVLAPGMGGVLFHEAVGHPLESDIVDKEASVYRGRSGERLASSILSGVDDATVPNAWGSFSFDDEGARRPSGPSCSRTGSCVAGSTTASGRRRTAWPPRGTGGDSPTRTRRSPG